MPEVDDDDLPELPPLGDEDEEGALDRDDLGLDELIEDADADEEVGLDDSTGFEDEQALFALELPPEEDPSEAAEEGVDAIPVEGIDDDAEYGWTEYAARGSDETWEPEEHELPSLRPLGHEDHGEEGVDDDVDLGVRGDDEVPSLPPLREDLDAEEEEADDLALGEDALIEEASLSFEEERQQMGRALPPALEAPGCVIEHFGADEVLAIDLGDPILVGGRGLFRLTDGASLERLDREGLEEREIVSIARVSGADGVVVVGERLGGVWRSEDGGRTFTPGSGVAESNVAQSFHVHAEAGGARLWGRTGTGGLYRSEDRGRTWVGPLLLKPVVAIATPAEGGVVALCAGRDAPPQLVGSEDGGARWAAVDGPALPVTGGELHVAVSGEYVAVASDADRAGPYLSSDGGRSWARVPGLPPTGPMALAREPGGLALYASHFFEGGDRGVVVRHRPDGGEPGVVLDVAQEAAARGVPEHGDSEGEHRVHALAVRREGSRTMLYAATGAGSFRARIDPDALP